MSLKALAMEKVAEQLAQNVERLDIERWCEAKLPDLMLPKMNSCIIRCAIAKKVKEAYDQEFSMLVFKRPMRISCEELKKIINEACHKVNEILKYFILT